MSLSLVFWLAAALLLFWSVGAYNRLVRLRASALQAFALLDTRLREQAEVVRNCLPQAVPLSGAAAEGSNDGLLDDMTAMWSGLAGAAAQFNATLAAARVKPLEADVVAALHAAQGVLHMAWQRLQEDDAHDLAGAALPESLQMQWRQSEAHVKTAAQAFNLAVEGYNEAIDQFPAMLLAWLFGFRPARVL